MKLNYPSISKFQQFVELKDYRAPTKKEYVRNVCKLAEHFQCDPVTLTENHLREYFLFLPQTQWPSSSLWGACGQESASSADCVGKNVPNVQSSKGKGSGRFSSFHIS